MATKDKRNVHDCDREQASLKTRYVCPDCKRAQQPRCWTSGKGLFVMIYQVMENKNGSFEIKLAAWVYGSRCLGCNQLGDMKAYEDEMERIGEQFGNTIAEFLNLKKPEKRKKVKGQRGSNGRKKHQKEHCEVCRAGLKH